MKLQEIRTGMLRRAVITSLAGKGVSVVTQLVAIPVAIGALGIERFGAYAMLTAIFLWTNTASSVVASALTLQIVSAHADGDAERESRLFSTAFFFALMTACLLTASFYLALETQDIGQFFALKTPQYSTELRGAAMLIAVLLPANVVLSLAEATHTGFQRQDVNNLLLTVANVFTIACLMLVVRWSPNIQNMVMAMFLPATASRAVNMLVLLRRHPRLLPRWGFAERPTLWRLLGMGAAFALMQSGAFLYQQVPTFFVGREAGLSAAAYLATMMMVITLSGSLLIIFTQPMMPALRDAMTRGDHAWIQRSYRFAIRRLVPYISLAALTIAVGGSFFVSMLTRHPVKFDWATQVLWAAFFWIVAWEHIHYTFAVGMGRLWTAAALYVAGSVLMLAASFSMIPAFGIAGAFASMCLGPLVFTVVSYPRMIRHLLQAPASQVQYDPALKLLNNQAPAIGKDCRTTNYAAIRPDCAIVAACDAKHALYLFNALASLEERFANRPQVVIYDIGLSHLQRLELARMHDLEVRPVPAFVAHWRLNWSWKLYVLTQVRTRYVLYLDLANVVVLRSLAPWFLAIQQHGYLVIANGQSMGEITPSDYWERHHLDGGVMCEEPTFGAGIIGFDRSGSAFTAIGLAFDHTMTGLNLGRSASEINPNYRPNTLRDCPCFRADQTLLNLAFRQIYGATLQVRRASRYCGKSGTVDHPNQYIWYSRRSRESLVYLFAVRRNGGVVHHLNRILFAFRLLLVRYVKPIIARLSPS